MAVPKRKLSKQKIRSRKASDAHRRPTQLTKPCPNCGAPHRSHRVCPACGYYRGRQVVTIKAE